MRYILSLDPAQLRDWSALSAIRMKWNIDKKRHEYALVALNRKQHLPYNEIVDWAIETLHKPIFREQTTDYPELVLDSTGVGVAIRDMFHQKGVRPKAIMITVGNGKSKDGGTYHVGKARLIGSFLAAYDSGKVEVNPNLPMWPQLEHEMLSFRAEMSSQGHAKFEAMSGEHDDLLLSLAQGVWYGEDVLRGAK